MKLNSNKVGQTKSKTKMNTNRMVSSTESNSAVNERVGEHFRVTSLLRETLDNSVAHAIMKIIETPYWPLKVFLFLCVVLSSGLCSLLILELIMSYMSFGVSTMSRIFYETSALFPNITICNVNPFTTRHALEFLQQINKEIYPDIDI
jgi:hypothetical protein